jgi:hypothetical protein
MGIAVSAMHYTGMAALSVEIPSEIPAGAVGGSTPAAILAPVLIGPVVFLFLAGVVVALDPPGGVSSTTDPGPGREREPVGDAYDRPGPGGAASGSRHRVRKAPR